VVTWTRIFLLTQKRFVTRLQDRKESRSRFLQYRLVSDCMIPPTSVATSWRANPLETSKTWGRLLWTSFPGTCPSLFGCEIPTTPNLWSTFMLKPAFIWLVAIPTSIAMSISARPSSACRARSSPFPNLTRLRSILSTRLTLDCHFLYHFLYLSQMRAKVSCYMDYITNYTTIGIIGPWSSPTKRDAIYRRAIQGEITSRNQ